MIEIGQGVMQMEGMGGCRPETIFNFGKLFLSRLFHFQSCVAAVQTLLSEKNRTPQWQKPAQQSGDIAVGYLTSKTVVSQPASENKKIHNQCDQMLE